MCGVVMGNSLTHGGNITEIATRFKKEPHEIIDFSANINPIGLPKGIIETITQNINKICYYPDPKCTELTNELAEYLGLKAENILIGNGSMEFIYIIPPTFKPERVLIVAPTFIEYELVTRVHGAELEFCICKERDNFEINVDRIVKHLPNIDMMFICNPNNPTGYVLAKEKLKFLASGCSKNEVMLVVDETFINFLEDEDEFTVMHNLTDILIVLRSFTKFFALPGLRLGYLISSERAVQKIKKFQPVWSVNTLAQAVGKEIISNKQYIENTKRLIHNQLAFLQTQLATIRVIKVFPSVTNFILCKFNKVLNYNEIYETLIAEHNIVVRNCSNFRGLTNRYFRVAVRSEKENEKLVTALKDILGET